MLFYRGRQRILDSNGDPVSGAKANFYLTGTTTRADTYSDSSLSTPHANPVVANSAGFLAPIYLDPAVTYKCVITDSSDVALPDGTVDPVSNNVTRAEIGASFYPRTAAEIAASVTPTDYAYPPAEHLEGDVRRVHILLSQGSDFGPYLQDAIDAAPSGGVVTIPASGSLYIETNVNIPKALELRGNNRRYSDLIWAGSSGVMLTTSDGASCDNVYLHDFEIGNVSGSVCDALLGMYAVRIKLERLFSNVTEDITQALIKTDTAATVYRMMVDGCDFHVSQISASVPYLLYYPRGHSLHVHDSFFNGFQTAGVKIGDGTNTVQGCTITSSRFESGDGVAVGYPGSATCYGIDVATCDGFASLGNNFEMVANASGSGAAHRAIILRKVKGATINGGYMTGNGIATALIELASSLAEGVSIGGGLGYASLASPGYLVTTSGGGVLSNMEIGHVYRNTSNTVGHYDPTLSIGLKFGGASTGITYASGYPKYSWSRRGRIIDFEIQIILTSKGSATGAATITGLPIASDSAQNEQPCEIAVSVMGDGGGGTTALTGHPSATVDNGDTKINLYQFTPSTGNLTALTDVNFKNTSEIYIRGSYRVA